MDFFVYSRDVAGTALRDDQELVEEALDEAEPVGIASVVHRPYLLRT